MQEAYPPYVVNFDRFLTMYKEFTNNIKFKEFEETCRLDLRSCQLSLPDFLVNLNLFFQRFWFPNSYFSFSLLL